jgi:hypothetical protein
MKRPTDETSITLRDALKQFGTRREAAAGRQIEAMGPEAVDRLLQMLELETRKRKAINRVVSAALLAYLVLFISSDFPWLSAPFWLRVTVPLIVIPSLLALMGASRHHNHVARALSKVDDVCAVGLLLQALKVKNIDQASVLGTLTRLLPRMQATDSHLLNNEQRGCLYRALRWDPREHSAFLVSALKALEQIGTEEALPLVDRLANGPIGRPRDPDVERAAQACLPFLKERAVRDREHRTLLRATESGEDSTEGLLRPAANTIEVGRDALLRSAGVQEQGNLCRSRCDTFDTLPELP